MKDVKIAVILSLIFPGLGHLYLRSYLDAVGFMFGSAVLWYALIVGKFYDFSYNSRALVFWLGFIAVYLIAVVTAYSGAKKKV